MTVWLLALTLLLLSTPLRGSENAWTPVGPEGGAVQSLAIASNGRTAYAGTATGQVFRSADTGRTWTLIVPNLGGAVWRLEADTIYAATEGGLYSLTYHPGR